MYINLKTYMYIYFQNMHEFIADYVGLVNQGSTCYLNTCIQVLYMTPEIKNAVYQWKSEVDEELDDTNYVLLELYELFWNLQVYS